MNINLLDRSGLPDHLVEGLMMREYEVRGYSPLGVIFIYWWVEASSRADALDRARERFAAWPNLILSVR